MSNEQRSWWSINVTGYGRFEFFGTKAEAEEMREHKEEWEGGRGTKRKAKPEEVAKGIAHLKWQQERGYGLDERELEALK